ncbi:hypothetical protein Y013_25985 (plasmid) [Rhodococcus pyridinivorans SB3094]|uniref:Uncharacterized protein n=2 Tax=Rhodococcus pyridinivorans TaxID=103816 RepID=V9XQQ3_9NOCA|nr:hypothetical protein Y013_25985 [Rhodococcus pyridinivorans SB3094]
MILLPRCGTRSPRNSLPCPHPMHRAAPTHRATPPGPNTTSIRRRVFRKTVIDRYLDSAPTPPREGRSALITAGPPGAGKSTLLRLQIADLQEYRRLDARLALTSTVAITEFLFDIWETR